MHRTLGQMMKHSRDGIRATTKLSGTVEALVDAYGGQQSQLDDLDERVAALEKKK